MSPPDRSSGQQPIDLPDEIWEMALKYISPDLKGELVSPEIRASLSEESFAPELPAPVREQPPGLRDLHNFRRSCPRYADLARRFLYCDMVVRFHSPRDFDTLNRMAGTVIAEHVKQFSYMIPRFFAYPQGLKSSDFEAVRETARNETAAIKYHIDKLKGIGESSGSAILDQRTSQLSSLQRRLESSRLKEVHIEEIVKKADNQGQIIRQQIDSKSLMYAFGQFKHLVRIRLMPLSHNADYTWEKYLDSHPSLAAGLRPSLSDAIRHCAQTLTTSIMRSGNTASRFSSRSLDLGTIILTDHLRSVMCDLARRFTTLDLQFVYRDSSIDDQPPTLSDLFLLVFRAAVQLQTLHVGFGRRVSIPLEYVFHDVHFQHLQYLGLHEWRLHAGELIELLDRHKNTLRSVRLRRVSLKEEEPEEDGTWRRVLEYIRQHLTLKWISLRGIYYNYTESTPGGVQFSNMIYGRPPDTDSDDSIDTDSEGLNDTWSVSDTSDSDEEAREQANNGTQTDDENDVRAQVGVGSHNLAGGLNENNGGPFNGHDEQDGDGEDDRSELHSSNNVLRGYAHRRDPGDSADESNDEEEDHDVRRDAHMSDLDDVRPSATVEASHSKSMAVRTSSSDPLCHCAVGYSWSDFTSDDGQHVTKAQWKRWEKWIELRCRRGHDPVP